MRLTFALALVSLLAGGWGCKSADKEEGAAPAATEPSAGSSAGGSGTARVDTTGSGAPKTRADAAPMQVEPVEPPPEDPQLAELEELAEMPELTAEATEEEINRRMERAIDAFSAFIDLIAEHDDCGKMGGSLSRFADVNRKFLENLQKLNNPKLSKRLSDRMMSRGTEWMGKVAKNLHRCKNHPAVMAALMKLARQSTGQ